MTDNRFRLLLLLAVPVLLGLVSGHVAEVIATSVHRGRPLPTDAFMAASLLGLTAVGIVVFVAASVANEWQSSAERRREDRVAAARASRARRLDRMVRPDQVVAAVREGARDATEVAEVLQLHRHVARQRLEELVEQGRLVVEPDGTYVLAAAKQPVAAPRTGARAARWIDPDGK